MLVRKVKNLEQPQTNTLWVIYKKRRGTLLLKIITKQERKYCMNSDSFSTVPGLEDLYLRSKWKVIEAPNFVNFVKFQNYFYYYIYFKVPKIQSILTRSLKRRRRKKTLLKKMKKMTLKKNLMMNMFQQTLKERKGNPEQDELKSNCQVLFLNWIV